MIRNFVLVQCIKIIKIMYIPLLISVLANNVKVTIDFSEQGPAYFFMHLKGQLMQFTLRNEIQERISETKLQFKNTCLS